MKRHVDLKNFRIAYELAGEGMPLLLVHGFPLNKGIWAQQLSGLASFCQVIAPDLRAHADSGAPAWSLEQPQAYTMDMLADELAEFLDAIGVQQKIVIGGLSMGGYVSFAFYRRYPARVAGMILAATRAAADSPEAKAGREKAANNALANGVGVIADAMLPRMFAPDTYQTNPELVEEARAIMLETSLAGVTGDLLGMRQRIDSTPTLEKIQVPVLVVHGEQDQIIPVNEAREMAGAIPAAKLVVVPGSGHLLNMEKPQVFNQAVAEFIKIIS